MPLIEPYLAQRILFKQICYLIVDGCVVIHLFFQRLVLRTDVAEKGGSVTKQLCAKLSISGHFRCWHSYFFRGRFGTKARNRRGLSVMMWCNTSSDAPAAFSFGRKTVTVLA